jgi:hypothetical protein
MKNKIIITYIDENNAIREVSLSDIIKNIGFDYSIPDEVLKLSSAKEIVKITANNEIVWSTIRRSYIAIVCKNAKDFNNYIKDKNIKGKRQTNKILHGENRTYIRFSSICDICSWTIDNYYETESAKENKEYEEILKIIRIASRIVAHS